MAVTKENIASMALIRLGGSPISDFNANTREAQVVSNMYDTVKQSLFNYAQWNFATKKQDLAQLNETITDKTYTHVYQMPTNTIRVIGVFDVQGYFDTNYSVENNKIYTRFGGAKIQFIELKTEDKFPAFFTECLVAKLAYEMAEAITGVGSIHQRLYQEFNEKLRKAMIADGQENPPRKIIDEGSLVRAHQGRFVVGLE